MRDERGKRSRRGRAGRRSQSVGLGSPYDFSADDAADARVDPVDLLAIRADDELLDLVVAGRSAGTGAAGPVGLGTDPRLGAGIHDDQQLIALLAEWRADIDSERFPDLVTVEEASELITEGARQSRPRRRLMPVASAAAVVVLAMSGIALGAGNAQPGDALWGVSRVLNGDRANSVEAAYKVTSALTEARQALAQGRVSEARAKLAQVEPELAKVKDGDERAQLSRRSANLLESTDKSEEGASTQTDEDGVRVTEPNRPDEPGSGHSTDPRSGRPDPSSDPRSSDPRFADPRSGEPSADVRSTRPSTDPRSAEQPRPSRPNPSTTEPEPSADPRSGQPGPGQGPGSGTGQGPGSGPSEGPGAGQGPGSGPGSGSGQGPGSDTGDEPGSGGGSGTNPGGGPTPGAGGPKPSNTNRPGAENRPGGPITTRPVATTRQGGPARPTTAEHEQQQREQRDDPRTGERRPPPQDQQTQER